MSTINPIPTLSDRLRRVPSDRLYVRLDVARSVFASATNPHSRLNAMSEIEACLAEIKRRGLPPSEEAA